MSAYPVKPICIVVPLPAGGPADLLARLLAERLSPRLGQTVSVVNRVGNNTVAGTNEVAKALPDGYTLLMVPSQFTVHPRTVPDLPYDVVKDFEPISMLALTPNILVAHPSLEADTVGGLVKLARAQPGVLTFGSGGHGSTSHLAAELFNKAAGIDIRHVPYDGAAPATEALLKSKVSILFSVMAPTFPHVKSGALKALAVTGDQRSRGFPDVPTMVESGYPDFRITTWQGLLAPAGTPKPIILKLNEIIGALMRDSTIEARLLAQGFNPVGSSPGEFAQRIQHDLRTTPNIG